MSEPTWEVILLKTFFSPARSLPPPAAIPVMNLGISSLSVSQPLFRHPCFLKAPKQTDTSKPLFQALHWRNPAKSLELPQNCPQGELCLLLTKEGNGPSVCGQHREGPAITGGSCPCPCPRLPHLACNNLSCRGSGVESRFVSPCQGT